MHPDGVIGEHRAGGHSQSSECDPSPRRATVDTGSEEPATPPQSPAISTGPGTEASRAETRTMEQEYILIQSREYIFLRSDSTSTEQESALLHQQDVGVDEDEKETTRITLQAAVRKTFVSPPEKQQREGRQHGEPSSTSYLIGADRCDAINFLKRQLLPCVLCLVFCCCLFSPLVVFFCLRYLSFFSCYCRSRYERRNELSGCTGCVNCCIEERSPSRFFADKRVFCVYLFVFFDSLRNDRSFTATDLW